MDFINIGNEYVRLGLSAFISLFCVFVLHDIVEGFVVYSEGGFSESAVRNWALLRSHGSLRDTIQILRGSPLIETSYQSRSSRSASCELHTNSKRPKLLYGRYFSMLFVRLVLVSIEVLFIALSLTRNHYSPISEGGVMIAWKGSQLGKLIAIQPKLGCHNAPEYNTSSSRNIVLARLVYCLESNVGTNSSLNQMRTPNAEDYSPFAMVFEPENNLIQITYRNPLTVLVTFRAYWSIADDQGRRSPDGLEGLEVPMVRWNTARGKKLCTNDDCLVDWVTHITTNIEQVYGTRFMNDVCFFCDRNTSDSISKLRYIMQFRIAPPSRANLTPSGTGTYWTKERQLHEAITLITSVLELSIIEPGSTVLYLQNQALQSIVVEQAFLRVQPLANLTILLLILIFLLLFRALSNCLRPNAFDAAFYSSMKSQVGLASDSAPLTKGTQPTLPS